jgi:uridine kinase
MTYKKISISLMLITFLLGSVNMATAQILPYHKKAGNEIPDISTEDKCYVKIKMKTKDKAEWIEILRPQKVNLNLLNTMIDNLKKAGYDAGSTKKIEKEIYKLDDKSIKALRQYQKDNDLPIGTFDIETLKALKVERDC